MRESELQKLFRHERDYFAEQYPRVRSAKLKVSDRQCVPESPCRDRDIAWCTFSTKTIWILRRAISLSKRNILGVIRHELGHLADPTPQKKHAESRADHIAEGVTRTPILYDRQGLQTTGKGGPRPRWLHD